MRITIIFVLVIILFSVFINIGWLSKKDFLNSLKGKIVYVERDKGILNVYKISANGKNKQLLYHNEDKVNSNCLKPKWSEDVSKIYFTAMRNGEWKRFIMNSDGANARVDETKVNLLREILLTSVDSREKDIIVKYGSIYYIDDKGNKIKVYEHKNYEPKFNAGAREASWNPDKEFIVFQMYKGKILGLFGDVYIYIANKEGTKVVKFTKGMHPDWKY